MRTLFVFYFLIGILTASYAQCNVSINSVPASDSTSCNGQLTAIASGQAPYTYNWSCSNGACIGMSGNTITNACPGVVYTVTVTDAGGCLSTISVVMTNSNSNPCTSLSISTVPSNATSSNICDGQVQSIVNGGTQPYVISISGNGVNYSGGPIFTNLCSGGYVISVTDANGCYSQTTASLSSIFNPCSGFSGYINSVSFASDTNTCDGIITSAVSGGTSPYSYSWSEGSTTSTILNGCAGIEYSVCITDANGCQVCDSVLMGDSSIVNCSSFTATINNTNVSLSGLCDGSATIIATGGAAPYSFLWSNGQTNQSLIDLCEGSYVVTVADANNCQITLSCSIGSPDGNVGDTIILNSGIFIDSNVVDTVYSGWIDNCNFDFNTIISATIDSYTNVNDSTWVTWSLLFNDGTNTTLTIPYNFNTSLGGVYDVVLQLYCGLRSTPQWLMAFSQMDFQPNSNALNEVSNNVIFYPNPTNGIIRSTIDLCQIVLLNTQGQSIKVLAETNSIDLSDLASGVYNIKYVIDNQTYIYRLIKE